nr:hypothetical protein [Tanacetum cinerariifolium]
MLNPEDITDPSTAIIIQSALMAKAFKLNYSTPTNNNQRILSNPRNRQIAQPGINMGQDRQMQMVGGYGENQSRQYAGQNAGNLNGYNAVQNVKNQNQIGNGNLVIARAEGNVAGHNGNQIRCYNCKGQSSTSGTQTDNTPVYGTDGSAETQLLIAQKKEAEIQLQAKEYDLMAAVVDLDEIEEISKLNKQLSKEKSTVSFLLEEKKRLKSDFETYEDKLLDKHIQLEKRIKELNDIVIKTGQSIQTIHMLSPKPDSFYHTEQKMALGYQNPFYLKQAQKKQQSLYDGKVLLEKHDPLVVHDSEKTLELA